MAGSCRWSCLDGCLGILPYETITGQIDDVSIQAALNARRMLTVAYGPKARGFAKIAESRQFRFRHEWCGHRKKRAARGQSDCDWGCTTPQYQRSCVSNIDSGSEFNAEDGRELWRQYAAVIEPFMLRGIPLTYGEGIKEPSSKRNGSSSHPCPYASKKDEIGFPC